MIIVAFRDLWSNNETKSLNWHVKELMLFELDFESNVFNSFLLCYNFFVMFYDGGSTRYDVI